MGCVSWNVTELLQGENDICRTPHGVCELKSEYAEKFRHDFTRRTPHGVCELKLIFNKFIFAHCCRTPHGVCELKFYLRRTEEQLKSRTPHGVCELKSAYVNVVNELQSSHPTWGVWVEIRTYLANVFLVYCRTPHGVCELKSSMQIH